MSSRKIDLFLRTLFFSTPPILAFLAYRWALLDVFKIYDEDQSILWIATNEILNGRFHEPCFYGQNYNTYLEALVAVPLKLWGMPLPEAVAWATSGLSWLPFVLLSLVCFWRDQWWRGFLILFLPLTLPMHYQMVTSMPRGFVTGIPFAVGGFIALTVDAPSVVFGFGAFLSGLAVIINPNSALIVVPAMVIAAIKVLNMMRRRPWVQCRHLWFFLLGLALAAMSQIGVWFFYRTHPHYVMFPSPTLHFNKALFGQGLDRLKDFWTDALPRKVGPTWFLGGLLVAALVQVAYRRLEYALAFAAVTAILIVSLGFDRIHGGSLGVWMPYSRMYLALPVVIAMVIYLWPEMPWARSFSRRIWPLAALLATYGSFRFHEISMGRLDQAYAAVLAKPSEAVIPQPMPNITAQCDEIRAVTAQVQTDVLYTNNGLARVYWYGCAALLQDHVSIVHPDFERRTWLLEAESKQPRDRIVVRDLDYSQVTKQEAVRTGRLTVQEIEGFKGYYLVKSQQHMNGLQMFAELGQNVRHFRAK